jgi:O-antigen biosynthesis protein
LTDYTPDQSIQATTQCTPLSQIEALSQTGPSDSRWSRVADGNFTLPHPKVALPFTGERMTSDIDGQIEFEHFHRYCVARDICVGKDVLDVASGEGYGVAMLAGVARKVVGVEIDRAAVEHARAAYTAANIEYLQGDAHVLPLPNAAFDVVVSFETLEHLRDQGTFLREVRRVLRPGGILIISTPDREVYSAPGQPVNQFHVLELSRPEFAELLGTFFTHHTILKQRTLLGSVMTPVEPAGAGWRSYDRRAPGMLEAMPGLSRAFYLIGIASDGKLPRIGTSSYAHNASIDQLLALPSALAHQREQAERERSLHNSEITDLNATLERANGELGRAKASLARTIEELRQMREAKEAAEAEIARLSRIEASSWWRVGAPLRAAGEKHPWAARQARRAVKLGYWTATGQLLTRIRARRALPAAPEALTVDMRAIDMRAVLGLPPAIDPAPEPARLALPSGAGTPAISLIIPTYGQVDYTLRCLASIAAAPPSVPVEVIVVDDASGDPRVATLRAVRGIRLIIRDENLGFLRSCNDAAKLAKGEFIMLLNNDTEVMPGAIDRLAELLSNRPDAGLVGARLLYPDGLQQEAGGIIWRDGSAWNYGNRDDPRKPEYNYVRDADFISGAAIMVRRAVWEQLGGFDEHFAPAYCEDCDLAFRVRAAGLKVLYQPAAIVIHHEGISHGTDTGSGIKAYQVTNTVKLRERHAETLRRYHQNNGERVMRARDRSYDRKVTLVIDHYVPEPDRDAGSRAMLACMEGLIASGRIVKFFPANGQQTPGYTDALLQRGIEVLYLPWCKSLAEWLIVNGSETDEILLSRPTLAEMYLETIKAHCRAPIVFYGIDLHHARMAGMPGSRQQQEADAMEALERRVWRAVDVSLYFSEEEAATVRRLEPGVDARAVPAYALTPPPPPHDPPPISGGLIFVAGFAHPPNVDAALWLVHDILPLIRVVYPDLPLALVGSNPTDAVKALAGPGIEVTGFVSEEELHRRYAVARVAICPLRAGAGVKHKVVEALHRGVPLVTTPFGAQGMPGIEKVCDVLEQPEAIAAAVIELLKDDALWTARAAAQSAFVRTGFSSDDVRDILDAAFQAVASRAAKR